MGISSIKAKDKVVCPIDTISLTKDKEYSIKKVFSDSHFTIKNDDGKVLHCKIYKCGHIENNDWILK